MSGIVSGLIERRIMDVNNAGGLIGRGLGSFVTASGVSVNSKSAMQVSSVSTCVDILSTSVAMLPYHTLEKVKDGKQVVPDFYVYPLLAKKANRETTAFDFRRYMMTSLLLRGNAFAYIQENRRGQIEALWNIYPDSVYILRNTQTRERWYGIEMPDYLGGNFEFVHESRMWHVTGLSLKPGIGLSMIEYHRQTIGLALATEEYGARFFSNSAIPGFILEHPGTLTDKAFENLKKSWNDQVQGLSRAHSPAILEEGLKAVPISISAKDSQLLETEKYQDTKIARIFRVPPHMIADLERSTNNNIEHQSLEFVTYSLMHWLINIEQSADMKLIEPSDQGKYYTKHSVNGLLRGDTKTRMEAYVRGLQSGIYSLNDIMELEDRNSLGAIGDARFMQLNMAPIETILTDLLDKSKDTGIDGQRLRLVSGDSPNPSVSTETLRHVPGRMLPPNMEKRSAASVMLRHRYVGMYQRVIQDTASRIVRREANDISGQVKKQLERGYEAFFAWLGDFYRDHEDFVYRNMLPLLQTYAEMVSAAANEEIDADVPADAVERFNRAYTREYARRHTAIGEKRLTEVTNKALENGDDIEAKVKEELEKWKTSYPETIARREAVRNGNAVAHFVYVASGIVSILKWHTFGENCPWCDSMDGRTVGIDQVFLAAGEALQPDGASVLSNKHDTKHPPLHDGCDCMIGAGG